MKKMGRIAKRMMAAGLAGMLAVSTVFVPAFAADTFGDASGVEDSMYDMESPMEDKTAETDTTADQPSETDSLEQSDVAEAEDISDESDTADTEDSAGVEQEENSFSEDPDDFEKSNDSEVSEDSGTMEEPAESDGFTESEDFTETEGQTDREEIENPEGLTEPEYTEGLENPGQNESLSSEEVRAFQDKVKIWKYDNQILMAYDSVEDIGLEYFIYPVSSENLLYSGTIQWNEQSSLYFEAVDFDAINGSDQADEGEDGIDAAALDEAADSIKDVPVRVVISDGISRFDEVVSQDIAAIEIKNSEVLEEGNLKLSWNSEEGAEGYLALLKETDGRLVFRETDQTFIDIDTTVQYENEVLISPYRTGEDNVKYFGEAVELHLSDNESHSEEAKSGESPSDFILSSEGLSESVSTEERFSSVSMSEDGNISFSDGDGTQANPFVINSVAQLNAVRYDLKSCYTLGANIDLDGINWTPIADGISTSDAEAFTGVFDGNGYTIENLTIISHGESTFYGLFGLNKGTIKNINIKNVSFDIDLSSAKGGEHTPSVGSIAGQSDKSITSCKVSGKIEVSNADNASIGGIVGYGNVRFSYNFININVGASGDAGRIKCGGITGGSASVNGAIDNCINFGDIDAESPYYLYVGGISGEYGAFKNCINVGNISGESLNSNNGWSTFAMVCNVGGIVGASYPDTFYECINFGNISGVGKSSCYVGGIAGWNEYYTCGTIKDCYNLGATITSSGAAARVVPRTLYASELYSLESTLVNGSIPTEEIGKGSANGESLTESEMVSAVTYILEKLNVTWSDIGYTFDSDPGSNGEEVVPVNSENFHFFIEANSEIQRYYSEINGHNAVLTGALSVDGDVADADDKASQTQWAVSDESVAVIDNVEWSSKYAGVYEFNVSIRGLKPGKVTLTGTAFNGEIITSGNIFVEPRTELVVTPSQLAETEKRAMVSFRVFLDEADRDYLEAYGEALQCKFLARYGSRYPSYGVAVDVPDGFEDVTKEVVTLENAETWSVLNSWSIDMDGKSAEYTTTFYPQAEASYTIYPTFITGSGYEIQTSVKVFAPESAYGIDFSTAKETENQKYLQELYENYISSFDSYMASLIKDFQEESKKEGIDYVALYTEQAKAMMDADESNQYLTFDGSISEDLKLYAYIALCRMMYECGSKKIDFSTINFSDTISASSSVVKTIKSSMNSYSKIFTDIHPGVAVDINYLSISGTGFGSININGHTAIICQKTGIESAIAEYLNQLKTLSSHSINGVYYNAIKDLSGVSVSSMNQSMIDKSLRPLSDLFTRLGLPNALNNIQTFYGYFQYCKKLANFNFDDKAFKTFSDEILKMNSWAADNSVLSDSVSKKASEKLLKAYDQLADAVREYYTTGKIAATESLGYKIKAIFKCPVSITVYAESGEEIGYVDDYETSYKDGILITEVCGVKTVYSNPGQKLTYKVTGTGSGKVSCTFEEIVDGTPTGRINYYDYNIEEGEEFEAKLTTGSIEDTDSIVLKNDSGAIEGGEYMSAADPDSSALITIEKSEEAAGNTFGEGKYPKGDAAILFAQPSEGYAFCGWYDSDGKLISASSYYEHVVSKSVRFKAVFSSLEKEEDVKFDIGAAEISGITNKTYTGKALTQSPVVKHGSNTLEVGTDYTISYKNNSNAGTATATITGKGNYTGTQDVTFRINPATISNTSVSGLTAKTYTGKALTHSAVVKSGSVTLKEGTDYTVSYKNNINAGTATIIFTGKGNYTGTRTSSFVILKAAQKISIKVSAASIAVGRTATVSVTGNVGAKSYKSSLAEVASVNAAGTITAKKAGSTTITATAAATANYNAASKTVSIKVVPAATSSITAENLATGIRLTWKSVAGATGYKVYRGSKLIKTIKDGSTVTCTDTTANANGTTYTFRVVPTAPTGAGLARTLAVYRLARPAVSSVKNTAARKMTVRWKKNARATGYQIQYSTNKKFASGNKTVNITKAATVSKVIGSLTKGKTYYVRIRTYKTIGKSKYWSAWSPVKSVKIKK